MDDKQENGVSTEETPETDFELEFEPPQNPVTPRAEYAINALRERDRLADKETDKYLRVMDEWSWLKWRGEGYEKRVKKIWKKRVKIGKKWSTHSKVVRMMTSWEFIYEGEEDYEDQVVEEDAEKEDKFKDGRGEAQEEEDGQDWGQDEEWEAAVKEEVARDEQRRKIGEVEEGRRGCKRTAEMAELELEDPTDTKKVRMDVVMVIDGMKDNALWPKSKTRSKVRDKPNAKSGPNYAV